MFEPPDRPSDPHCGICCTSLDGPGLEFNEYGDMHLVCEPEEE